MPKKNKLSKEAELLLPTILELFREGVLRIDLNKEYNNEKITKNYPCIIFEYDGTREIISKSSKFVTLDAD